MKKIISLVFMFTIIVTLSACGTGGGDDLNLPPGVTKLDMWVHVSQEIDEGRVYKKRIDEFNKQYKDDYYVQVSYIPRGSGASGYEEKVIAAHTTNSLPDVITLDGPNTAAYAISEMLEPLDSYLTAEDKNDFLPSILQQGTYDGKLYSLGQMESTVGLYYNKDMFNRCNVTPATMDNPWTWADLENNAEILKNCLETDKTPMDLHLYDRSEWITYALTPFLWSNGGRLVSSDGLYADGHFNSTKNAESLNFLKGMLDKGLVVKTTTKKPFHNGAVAMSLEGPWVISELQDPQYAGLNWGVMPYPKKDNAARIYSPTGSWAFGLTTASKDKEGAALLVKWMTNKETTTELHQAIGMLPARKSALNALDYYNDPNSPHYVLRQQLQRTGRARPSTPSYPVITKNFADVIEALTLNQNMQNTLDDKIANIERDLRRFRN